VTVHELHPEPGTTTDVFDRSAPLVLTVHPGDTVVARTLDAAGFLERQRMPWIQCLYDVDRGTATALASSVVDLRVTQVANETWGVHAVLAHGVVT
jgi:acetamidase/formamidase